MPLNKSGTKQAFSSNVSELMHSGYPQKQALAISYSVQRRGKANGGDVWGSTEGIEPSRFNSDWAMDEPMFVPDPNLQDRVDFWKRSETEVPSGKRPTPFDSSYEEPIHGGKHQAGPAAFDWSNYPMGSQGQYESDQAMAAREAAAKKSRYGWLGHSGPAPGQPGWHPRPRGLEDIPSTLYGAAAYAADPFGLPSAAANYLAPGTGDAWRDVYARNPSAQTLGNLTVLPGIGRALGATGSGIGKGVDVMGNVISAVPRTALGATAGAAAMIPSVAGEAEAQPWWQQQQQAPVQRDYRAIDRTREIQSKAAAEKAQRDAEQRQLQQSMPAPDDFKSRGLDPNVWQRRWFSLTPEQRSAYVAMPPPEQLSKLRVAPEAWMSMSPEQHRDTLYGLTKLEEAERLKNTPFLEKHPEISLASMGLAWLASLKLGLRPNSFAKKEISEFMGEWEKAQQSARSVLMKEGAKPSEIKDAISGLRTWDNQFSQLRSNLAREQTRARIMGSVAGLQGAALPYELDAALGNPEMAGKQLLKPETWARMGISAFTGGGGASIANALTKPFPKNLHTLQAGSQYLQGGPNRGMVKRLLDLHRQRKNPLPYADGGILPYRGARPDGRDAPNTFVNNSLLLPVNQMRQHDYMQGAPRFDSPEAVRGRQNSRKKPANYGGVDVYDWPTYAEHRNAADTEAHDVYAGGGGVPDIFRSASHDLDRYGMRSGPTPGRSDMVPTSVRGGSYVIPADIVSSLGQGNSAAGGQTLSRMFKMGPYGTQAPPMPHHGRMPMPRMRMGHADGGGVPINVSDGEFLVPPEKVAEIGGGDVNHGHDVLDRLVELQRQKTIRHLASLPPPKDSQQNRAGGGGDEYEESGNPYAGDSMDEEASEAPIPEPLDRNSPMLKAITPYGVGGEYGRRLMGLRRPSLLGYD